MSIQAAYNDWSAIYDTNENLTRDLDQNALRETLATQHFKSILEIGCGTGKNTAFLAQIGDEVHALDFSEGMIGQARRKLQAGNIRFTLTDLTKKWPCDNASIDLIVCDLVLEHIEDLVFIFAEAARVLRTDGKFFISELHPFRQYQGTKANFQQNGEKTEVQAFVHHISDFLDAANTQGLKLSELKEWWHRADQGKPPRVISFLFEA